MICVLGRVYIQPGAVDTDQVLGLWISAVVTLIGLVHGALLHAVHSWIHAVLVAGHSRRSWHGKCPRVLCIARHSSCPVWFLQKIRLLVRIEDDVPTLRAKMQAAAAQGSSWTDQRSHSHMHSYSTPHHSHCCVTNVSHIECLWIDADRRVPYATRHSPTGLHNYTLHSIRYTKGLLISKPVKSKRFVANVSYMDVTNLLNIQSFVYYVTRDN